MVDPVCAHLFFFLVFKAFLHCEEEEKKWCKLHPGEFTLVTKQVFQLTLTMSFENGALSILTHLTPHPHTNSFFRTKRYESAQK